MTCPNCSAPIPAEATFCPNCGKKPSMAGGPVGGQSAAGGARTYSGQPTIAPMRESRQPALEPGAMFADRYEVIRKIGEGGMGVVYLAKDSNTGEELVLKLIHPDLVTGDEAIKRLLSEGLTARQIRHPNIVAVYDVAQHDGQPYFTMEYVKGGTLRSWMVQRMRGGSEVSLETAVGLVRSMLPGLAEAHRMGVVHRDLKPENVLLCGDPEAGNFDLKILDFGIAKAFGKTGTGGGGPIGTPLYMAPEQMTSADAVGPQADLYSLSVIFYELLMEASPQARWEPISKNRPGVPKAIDDLIERGLSARPRSRPASAEEYASALDVAMDRVTPGPGPVPDPPPPPPPPPTPMGPNAWARLPRGVRIGITALGAVVGLAVIGNMMDDGSGPRPDPPVPQYIDPVQPQPQPRPQPPPQPQPQPEPPPPSPPPQPPVQAQTASGVWTDDMRNRYTAQHDGFNFVATGFVPGTGNVQIRGTLNQAGAVFGVYSADTGMQFGFFGTGTLHRDPQGHVDIAYRFVDGNGVPYSGRWHINHQ